MKTTMVLSVLIVVLQASLCLASRPGVSRVLLQDTIAAGTACESGELCSDGSTCGTAQSSKCPSIPAGLSCKSGDLCVSTGAAATWQLCPADPDTLSGTCPPIPAESACLPKDLCAISATETSPCVVRIGASAGTCSELLSGATCSTLSGPCAGDEECSAAPTVIDPKLVNAQSINNQDSTPGVCTLPKAAGAACTAGADFCQNQGLDVAGVYCPKSPCSLTRPGQQCSFTNLIDKCYDGGVTRNGKSCLASPCPALDIGKPCLVGDLCSPNQVCNAVGTNPGVCVDFALGGIQCLQATTNPVKAADTCRVTRVDSKFFLDGVAPIATVVGQACPSPGNKCPFVPAGQVCLELVAANPEASPPVEERAAEKCSQGNDAGEDCTGGRCEKIANNAFCYEFDQCANQGDFCNGQGATPGKCLPAKPAGAACGPTDTCYPTGALCPAIPAGATTATCPPVAAGAACQVTTGSIANSNLRVADKCRNGTTTVDCPTGGQCPVLQTGVVCAPSDLCVVGAKCVNGKCYPNSKVFASSTPPAPAATTKPAAILSNSTVVPAVKSVVRFSVEVSYFTEAEKAKFCRTLEASMLLPPYNAASKCTVNQVVDGSAVVTSTVAFTGASGAEAAQAALAQTLRGQDATSTTVFGSDYGVIKSVTGVDTPQVTNPTTTPTSGAAAVGMAWTVGVTLMVSALVMTV